VVVVRGDKITIDRRSGHYKPSIAEVVRYENAEKVVCKYPDGKEYYPCNGSIDAICKVSNGASKEKAAVEKVRMKALEAKAREEAVNERADRKEAAERAVKEKAERAREQAQRDRERAQRVRERAQRGRERPRRIANNYYYSVYK